MAESFLRANNYYKLKQWKLAVQNFEHSWSVGLDPFTPVTLTKWAKCLFHLGRLEDALEKVREALQADPSILEAVGLLGIINCELEEHEDAVSLLQEALKRKGDRSDVQREKKSPSKVPSSQKDQIEDLWLWCLAFD